MRVWRLSYNVCGVSSHQHICLLLRPLNLVYFSFLVTVALFHMGIDVCRRHAGGEKTAARKSDSDRKGGGQAGGGVTRPQMKRLAKRARQ